MKLIRLWSIISLGFLCPNWINAQGIFTVSDPQMGWPNYRATIESATITVRPVGLYSEIGLYLTVSAKDASFQAGTALEAVLRFDLPKTAMVNDSWLWVDSTIIQAKILDRWTASSIFENIVNRRKDPSILTKDNEGSYTLRIYPLLKGQSRKIKISYLILGEWGTQDVKTTLPADILLSGYGGDSSVVDIHLILNDTWKNPRLISHPDLLFSTRQDSALGQIHSTRLEKGSIKDKKLTLSLPTPMKNGLFLARYGTDQQGYYQLALQPDQFLTQYQNAAPRHILVLVHFSEAANYGLPLASVLDPISAQLKQNLRPQDFFNVIVGHFEGVPIAPDWIAGQPEEIDRIFNAIKKAGVNSFNLPGLMAKGISYAREKGVKARIILFANSITEGDYTTSTDLLKELSKLNESVGSPFFIADYSAAQRYYNYSNGLQINNNYLYNNLARATKGDYQEWRSCCSSNLETLAKLIIENALSDKANLDLHTALKNGFCYNRYNLNQSNEFVDLRKPLYQIGRYQGQWPFMVEVSGGDGPNLFFDASTIDGSATISTDSTGMDVWTGAYLAALEQDESNNSYVQTAIYTSIQERILSRYTAFLCLEPSLGGEPCLKCWTQTQTIIISTRDLQDSLVLSKISPNPFRERVMIQLKFKELIDLSNARIAVYNHLGQVVRTFSDVPKGKVQDLELHWDGNSDGGVEVPPGVYIFRLQTPSGQYSRKLVKLDR